MRGKFGQMMNSTLCTLNGDIKIRKAQGAPIAPKISPRPVGNGVMSPSWLPATSKCSGGKKVRFFTFSPTGYLTSSRWRLKLDIFKSNIYNLSFKKSHDSINTIVAFDLFSFAKYFHSSIT
jgi:hypothetical protein